MAETERPRGAGVEAPAVEIEEGANDPMGVGAPEVAPDLGDLDDLLGESAQMAKTALMSEQEVDELLTKREAYIDRYTTASRNKESRLRRVEGFNPLKDLDAEDYDSLIAEGVVDRDYADKLEHLDEVIEDLEAVSSPSEEILARLAQLLERRAPVREWLEGKVQDRKEALAQRREDVRAKLEAFYIRRINELTAAVVEIEANPRVQDRLDKEAEVAVAELKAQRQEVIREVTRYVASLSARHGRAFNRLTQIAGEAAVTSLMDIPQQRDSRTRTRIVGEVREAIMDGILKETGDKQVREPKEIVPWAARTSSIDYFGALEFLRTSKRMDELKRMPGAEEQQAQRLLEDRDRILLENEVLRSLFGSKWRVDAKTKKKTLAPFWAAFDRRVAADKKKANVAAKAQGAGKK